MRFPPWRKPTEAEVFNESFDEIFGSADGRRMRKWPNAKLLEEIHGRELSPARKAEAQAIYDRRVAWRSPAILISGTSLIISAAALIVAIVKAS